MAKAKKAQIVKASVLNATSDEKGASFYVIAAAVPEVKQDLALASFVCASCTTHFGAIKGSQPFCVTCGSDEVDVDEGEGALSAEEIEDEENLANVECSSCGKHNIITLETASAFGTKMHCVTCGSEIEYMPPTEGEEVDETLEDVELSEADDDMSDDVDELTISDDIEGAEEAALEQKTVDKVPEGQTKENDNSLQGSDATDKVDAKVGITSEAANGKVAAPAVAATETAADEEVEEEVVDAVASDDDSDEEADIEEATLASLVQGDFSLSRYGDRLVAFVGGVPVAHLEKASAGSNAGVFHTTAFANAVRHQANKVGAEKALAHFKFEIATVAFDVKSMVEARVQKGVDASKQEVASKIKDVSDDMLQALSIVAAGLNKNWFKGTQHILKDALRAELSSMGLRNPSKALDKVFAQYSDPYHKLLLEKATELLGKSVEHRNELAEAMSDMNYQPSEEEIEEEEVVEDMPVEARLEGAGLRTGRKTSEKASVNVVDLRGMADQMRARHGRVF